MDSKNIYLTFDDGPTIYTNRLLDILKEYNVKATFFVNGYNLDSPDGQKTLKRIIAEGHSLGLHSNTHDYAYIYKNDENFLNDINTLSDKIYNITGYRPQILRFPGGSSNTISKRYNNGIMRRLVKKVQELGYTYFDWNINSFDTVVKDPIAIAGNVINELNKKEGNVVIQHDTKLPSIEAVPLIIGHGLANNYKFLPLTKDSPPIHHNIYN
jgi:peptidoglycan-N-acetylglucosamine deacetylase